MTSEDLERMAHSLDSDVLEVLDGESDGFEPNRLFNPCSIPKCRSCTTGRRNC